LKGHKHLATRSNSLCATNHLFQQKKAPPSLIMLQKAV
jgi:hypothetical protein